MRKPAAAKPIELRSQFHRQSGGLALEMMVLSQKQRP
jgi:hypothetical protein